MTEIIPTTSYVRTPEALRDRTSEQAVLSAIRHDGSLSAAETQRLWELLETPQTVDSLCRVLGEHKYDQIRSALAALYQKDLIQVSPDT
ncbi:MAG: hypothetical protein C0P74_008125 [Gammaproteobacteria bacterium]|nr:hypothetical protein [Gammaproteobacteria bacterium]